jgi:hypothetical protein
MAASGGKSGWLNLLQSAEAFTTHIHAGLLYMLHCSQGARKLRQSFLNRADSDSRRPELQVDDDVANRL